MEPDPIGPSTGWGVLHLFGHVDGGTDAEGIVEAVKNFEGDERQLVPFAVLGHKADIGVMALAADLWRLRHLQTELQVAGVAITSSYVSITEVSEYSKGLPEEMLTQRLYPQLPPAGKRAICFYPMSKRRDPNANWFTLPFEQRKELMYGHGKKCREYAGRVVQLITGSTGIDDWEWGVTLFADDPVSLKDIVYEMRFDEASAVYADFGPFFTGLVGDLDEVLAGVGLG